VSVNSATLVIGGGIAGIQAALEIADSGHQVYLVERWPTIGGHMAMFDKTFPTLDCSACILTPKMVAAGQHQNIKLMVLSEVKEVTGRAGEFRVKVLQHATRVDPDACVACNDCSQICPTSVDSEFDAGIAKRKAIYLAFQQAVPNSYVVDPGACLWIQSGGKKCGACLKKCAKDAIHLDAQDEVVELEVGNIIVATGYDPLDAHRIERYGYGKLPNVITALEFERLSNASGPTGGKILLKEKKLNKRTKQEEWVFHPDNAEPKSVAIIHCVGSRDRNYNPYCSRVCCMYSLKFAHLVKDRLHDAYVYEYYIDMRAFGKNYEDFFERVKEEGVFVSRGRTTEVVERNGQMMSAARTFSRTAWWKCRWRWWFSPWDCSRPTAPRNLPRCSASAGATRAGLRSLTTIQNRTPPNAAVFSWPVCARDRRTFRIRLPSHPPLPPACCAAW